MQARIMKEAREAAAKRRKEEEQAEEDAKKERLRKKLESLGHFDAMEKEKEKERDKEKEIEKEKVLQAQESIPALAPMSNPVESIVQDNESAQVVGSDRLMTSDKTTELKVTLETSRDPTIVPSSTVPEKQVNEPWRSTSVGNKGWSGQNRQAQNTNPWHPVEGEQRRFPQLESLPFNGMSEKSLHRPSNDEHSQSLIDPQNRPSTIKMINSSTRPDHGSNVSQSNSSSSNNNNNNNNTAQHEYLSRPTHTNPHLSPLSPPPSSQQQHHHHHHVAPSLNRSPQQQHQSPHSEVKPSPTNTLTQNNYQQSYRESSKNPEREQSARYSQRQDMRAQTQTQTRNRYDVLPDSRGGSIQNNSWLSSNPDSSSRVASSAWQTAAYDIQRNEAMEKERRRVESLAQEEALRREGRVEELSETPPVEAIWRKVEVGKDGRRRYVGVVKTTTDESKKEQPMAVVDKDGSSNVNHATEPMSVPSERHHPTAFPQGPPVMTPQFPPPGPGPMRHNPSSGMLQPRSRFFPGTNVPMTGQHASVNEHVYPNTIEPLVVSPPTMQAYPHHPQSIVNPNHSSVVVTLPSQQHTAYTQHGINRFNSPPHVPAILANKSDLSASQLASTSSKSTFEMVQSKILGMVRPVGSHSRDASTELQADVLGQVPLVGELTSLELETTSKPSFDEFREEKVTVSLPRSSQSDDQDNQGWEDLTRYESSTLPSIDDVSDELFPQEFGSLPTVRLPRVYPDALKDPAKPPPEVSRGSKNGKRKLEVLSVDRDAGPLFNTTNEFKEKLFFLKLDANSSRSEAYLLKGKNNSYRRTSSAIKSSSGRGNYKMAPKPMPNSHYAQPPTYPSTMGPMLHNMNHGFPPRGTHPQNPNPSRMLHSPRKISGAV